MIQAYDARRERVIKTSRDIQKLAKSAVFAIHRGKLDDANEKICKAMLTASECFEQELAKEPSLRHGSYSNAIEELSEARLFLRWMKSIQENGGKGTWILSPEEMEAIPAGTRTEAQIKLRVTAREYLGGAMDLTGEIGTFFVPTSEESSSLDIGYGEYRNGAKGGRGWREVKRRGEK